MNSFKKPFMSKPRFNSRVELGWKSRDTKIFVRLFDLGFDINGFLFFKELKNADRRT
jgi:hypothetical protein